MTPYQEAIRLLTQAAQALATAGEPGLVMLTGALVGKVKAARQEARRDEEFGRDQA